MPRWNRSRMYFFLFQNSPKSRKKIVGAIVDDERIKLKIRSDSKCQRMKIYKWWHQQAADHHLMIKAIRTADPLRGIIGEPFSALRAADGSPSGKSFTCKEFLSLGWSTHYHSYGNWSDASDVLLNESESDFVRFQHSKLVLSPSQCLPMIFECQRNTLHRYRRLISFTQSRSEHKTDNSTDWWFFFSAQRVAV